MKHKIGRIDIIDAISFLRLRPTFLRSELREHFLLFSERYHPEAINGNLILFEQTVFSYELLSFFYKKIKVKNLKDVINEINNSQLKIINQKVLTYSKMPFEDFLNMNYKSSTALKIFSFFVYFIMGSIALLMLILVFAIVEEENNNWLIISERGKGLVMALGIAVNVIMLFVGKITHKMYISKIKAKRIAKSLKNKK